MLHLVLMIDGHGPAEGVQPHAAMVEGCSRLPALPRAIGLPSLGTGLHACCRCSRAEL